MTFNKNNGKFLGPPMAQKKDQQNDYGQLDSINQTRISIKAQKVLNNSIQTLMKARDNSTDEKRSKAESPIPVYPNFEA